MGSPDDFLYEYAVIRFVPRVERGEFINIGLLMLCKRQQWMKGEIEIDEKRVLSLDPHANIESLLNQAIIFETKDVPFKSLPAEEKYRWLTATKSAVLQVSPSHPGLIETSVSEKKETVEILEKEFNRLFRELVLL